MDAKIKTILEKYNVDDLISMAMQLDEEIIPKDSIARQAAIQIFGVDDLIHLLGLAVPLSVELASRLKNKN